MNRMWLLFLFCFIFWTPGPSLGGVLSSITMKDGSILHGDVIQMVNGQLQVEAPFGIGDPFLLKWEEVQNVASSQPLILVLVDGSSIKGTVTKSTPGELKLASQPLTIAIPISLSDITAINPPPQKPVQYVAKIDFGGKFSSGNTSNKQANLLSTFSARSKQLRLNIDMRYFYSDDDGIITDRNAFGSGQMDFFFTDRWFFYVSVLLEQDTFDDLNLRTSVSGGPGYQFIEKGDFTNLYLREMELSSDIGVGYFNEDRKIGLDDSYATFRWSTDWNWPVLPGLSFFHRNQAFPSTEDLSDFYINTIQGIRVGLWEGFNLAIQLRYKYDNTPPPSTGSSDSTAIVSIGYVFKN